MADVKAISQTLVQTKQLQQGGSYMVSHDILQGEFCHGVAIPEKTIISLNPTTEENHH